MLPDPQQKDKNTQSRKKHNTLKQVQLHQQIFKNFSQQLLSFQLVMNKQVMLQHRLHKRMMQHNNQNKLLIFLKVHNHSKMEVEDVDAKE